VAGENDDAPQFLILDGMNLARAEYYLAEFLSVMESDRDESGFTIQSIPLHGERRAVFDGPKGESATLRIPAGLLLPPQLFFVGTVNTDETTHAFSPKVLDRAFSIEFNDVDLRGLEVDGEAPTTDDIRDTVVELLSESHPAARSEARARGRQHEKLLDWLQALNEELAVHNMHFGYRVRDEIFAFVGFALASSLADGFNSPTGMGSFDAAVLMKVLPKFHGPRARLLPPLSSVLAWATNPDASSEADERISQALAKSTLTSKTLLDAAGGGTQPALPRTASKAAAMLYDAATQGFTSYA